MADDGEGPGLRRGRTEAHDDAAGDEPVDVGGRGGHDRTGAEDGDAGQHDLLAAEQVAQRPPGQHEGGERQGVAVDDPLQGGDAGMQAALDVGQPDADHGVVEEGQEQDGAERGQRQRLGPRTQPALLDLQAGHGAVGMPLAEMSPVCMAVSSGARCSPHRLLARRLGPLPGDSHATAPYEAWPDRLFPRLRSDRRLPRHNGGIDTPEASAHDPRPRAARAACARWSGSSMSSTDADLMASYAHRLDRALHGARARSSSGPAIAPRWRPWWRCAGTPASRWCPRGQHRTGRRRGAARR